MKKRTLQQRNSKDIQQSSEVLRNRIAPKVFAALMSVILAVGLIPNLGVSQTAYAAQDDGTDIADEAVFAIYSEDDNSLTFYADDIAPVEGGIYNNKIVTEVYTGFDTQSYDQNSIPWSDVRNDISSVATDESFAHVQPISCAFWFYQFSNCLSMDLKYLDTVAVTNTTRMFYNCSALTSLDVTNLDISSVTNMSYMFDRCSSLTSLDVTNFDTSAVTNMSYLFYECSALTTLDLSDFDTSAATNISGMFYNCSSLVTLDVTNFDTSGVTDMSFLFYGCSSLTALDVTNFDTSAVTNMSAVFYNCSSLVTLDVTNFDTSAVTDMSSLFYGCSTPDTFDVSNFDTSSVKNMRSMFYDCTALTSLDLSNFDTSAVTNMAYMFYRCSSLASLDLSSFDTSVVTNMTYMFYNCSSLTALDVSLFDTTKVTTYSYFLIGTGALNCLAIGDDFDLFVKSSSRLTESQKWYDAQGEPVANFLIGVNTAGTYYTYAHIGLTKDMFDVDVSDVTYTSAPIEPSVEAAELTRDADYTVEYTNNVNVGKGIITITGAGIYCGTLTYEFVIDPAKAVITCDDASKVYGETDPVLTGTVEGLLKADDLGVIEYVRAAGEEVGTYTISADYTPNANYEVSVVFGTFTIRDAPEPLPQPTPQIIEITPDMFAVDTSYGIFDGVDPVFKTITSDLVEGVDYTVEYENNNAAGNALITICGIGDFEGILTYTFKIIHYFEDVGASFNGDNEWYFDAVYNMVDLGAITGYNETTFGVGDAMSRAQLVTIMWRYCEPDQYAHYDESSARNATDLPDNPDGTYYTGAVNWAVENDVVSGNLHEDGTYTFNPDDPISFEQMITIVARYVLGGIDAAADYPTTSLDNGAFTDATTVSSFARGGLSWAIDNEVVTGNDNHNGTWTLSPLENVARERATTVLYRTIDKGLLAPEGC